MIVVTYNSEALVVGAVRSAEEAALASGLDVEVVIVDNASADRTLDVVRSELPSARVVANPENVGFGSANNQAFELANGDLWLLLNPDAVLERDTLGPLVEFLADHDDVAGVSPTLPTPWRGGPESAGMLPGVRSMIGQQFLVNRLLSGDRGGPWRGVGLRPRPASSEPRPVDWLSAAVFLVRPAAIRSVRGFDPRIFLYGEDVDLCDRLAQAGWRLWLVPEATAAHQMGASHTGTSTRWVDATHDFYAARAPTVRVAVFDGVLALGLTARAAAWTLAGRSPAGRAHARRMRVSAARAWHLAARTVVGRGRSRR